MAANYSLYVFSAAVADFDCVFIEDLVQWAWRFKMLFNQFEENGSNVGFYVFIKWRVEP